MAFDGIVTKAIVTELKNTILGSHVNKISQPTKTDIVLSLYGKTGANTLEISTNPDFCRISLTNYSKQNPQTPPNFCMLLRKYIQNTKIVEINTFDLDRVIEIVFEGYNELNDLVKRKLYIEIMSRQSNIILTNEKDMIIDTIKHIDSTRELLPAHEYILPVNDKKSFLNENVHDFKNEVLNFQDKKLHKSIPSIYTGISRQFIKKSASILAIDLENYTENQLEDLFNYIKNIISNFGTQNINIAQDEKDYNITLNTCDINLPINTFIDDYYHKLETLNLFTSARNNLLKVILSNLKKVEKKLDNINEKLIECDKKEIYKLYGELITANLYKIDTSKNLSEISLENYYEENKLITIPLDNSLPPNKNAEKYFKKYTKLKNALEIVSKQKQEALAELNYIESIVFSLSTAQNLNDIEEIYEEVSENVLLKRSLKNKFKKNRKFTKPANAIELYKLNINDYTVYMGKNNVQNDYLTLKFADRNDLWFHAQKYHGSHIILKTNSDDDIDEDTLFRCAKLAKENSKAQNALNIPVDYCPVRYVKKAPGAKPGMVIYTNFKTIIVP